MKIPSCSKGETIDQGNFSGENRAARFLREGSALFNRHPNKNSAVFGRTFRLDGSSNDGTRVWQTETAIFRDGCPRSRTKDTRFRAGRINDSVGSSRVRLSAD